MTSDVAQEKIVWLVGAGASVSDTRGHFPSLLDIPAKARATGVLGEDLEAEPGLKQLVRYLRSRSYGDLTDPTERVNLEHVLTLLEIDIAVSGEPKLLMARKYVLRLLRLTMLRLHKTLRKSQGEYKRLVDTLGQRDTLITFNWDVLLDEALGRSKRLESAGADRDAGPTFPKTRNRYDDFLLELTGWGERTWKGVGVPAPVHTLDDRGYFIKAHGSIDWYYCSNPGCRSFETVFPLLGSTKRPICYGCRERTEVLIVPPTMNKRLRDVPLTRRLWTLAASELERANEIVAWGYSLPPTDFFSEWLLRHARSSNCRRLVLINPQVVHEKNGEAEANIEFVMRFVQALQRKGERLDVEVYRSYDEFESQTPAVRTALLRRLLDKVGAGTGQ